MTKSGDFIPSTDSGFDAWVHNFLNYATANLAPLELAATDLAPLQAGVAHWEAVYSANVTTRAAAQAATQAKDDGRDSLEAELRPLAGLLQAKSRVTDAHRLSLGLTVRATTRTPVSTPTTRPVAQVDTSQRLQHTISWHDEATPSSRARPAGFIGCEIYTKVGGPPPVDPEELKYQTTDTATPYLVTFDGADAGKTVYYMLRWVNTRGQKGPWSQTVSATITN